MSLSLQSAPPTIPGATSMTLDIRRTISLNQRDVMQGTKFLDQSHTRYVLSQDIVFDPQVAHDPSTFVLGFFAAFAITGTHIELDLNGFTLRQSERHRKQQRFFSLIELGNSPFETTQGPANFGTLISASHVKVHNGVLGLSSHHGIHGNRNAHVLIENLRIRDFEVAGLHFNNPLDLIIQHCQIGPSNVNIPVRGRFSAGTFILPILQSMDPSKTLSRRDGSSVTVATAITNLQDAMDDMDPIFANPSGLNDGTVYGIVVNQRGVAVHDFAQRTHAHPADNVTIVNTCIEDLHAAPQQIVGIECDEACDKVGYKSGKVQADLFGSMVDIELWRDVMGNYQPNPLADAQLLVYKYLDRGNISPALMDWAEHGEDLEGDEVYGLDSMAHVIKGNIGIFLNSVTDFNVRHCAIDAVRNSGFGDANGIVVASCQRGMVSDLSIAHIQSKANVSGVRGIGDNEHLQLTRVQVSRTSGVAFQNLESSQVVNCIGCLA